MNMATGAIRGIARTGGAGHGLIGVPTGHDDATEQPCAGLERRPVAEGETTLHRKRRRLAAADAQRRDAAPRAARLHRRQQRDENPRPRGADGVAERAGAAVHVDLVVRQVEIAHRRHRHHRESLVDLEEIDIARRQPVFSNSFFIAPIGAVGNLPGSAA